MKFMLTFDWSPNTETRAEAVERFRKTGALPPEGVKLLGRWTRADLSGGFDLLETDDAKKLFEFAYMWGTLMELEITPVLDDQELKAALESATMWIPPWKTELEGERLSNTPPDKQRGFAGKPPKNAPYWIFRSIYEARRIPYRERPQATPPPEPKSKRSSL